MNKTIWILWLQGWDDAPWLVQQVRRSWEILNDDWNVVPLTKENISSYIEVPTYLWDDLIAPAAKSDIIRLHLLARHGGVWADATMLCMVPLNHWLYEALEPVGFWMYHGRDGGTGPASWFIVATTCCCIPTKWAQATDLFWNGLVQSNSVVYDYFWMDALFKTLIADDPEFAAEWKSVPYLYCDAPGQAHMLAGKVNHDTPELKEVLLNNPPYAVKLSHHDFHESNTCTNGYAAITYSFMPRTEYPVHIMTETF